MKEITAAEILRGASAHIEANGCLFGAWHSGDDTKNLLPCCCLLGTLRLVAGLPPSPGMDDRLYPTDALQEAVKAVEAQTLPERISLGWERHGTKDADTTLALLEWSDHFADIEAIKRMGRDGRDEHRRLDHEDGDRGHVARVLLLAAERCEQ